MTSLLLTWPTPLQTKLLKLEQIANIKLSIHFQMWALSPSIFDLYSKYLDINQPSISVQYPAVQFAILQSMYSHCTRYQHNAFVPKQHDTCICNTTQYLNICYHFFSLQKIAELI